jgi:hypothetical protein
MIDRLTVRRSLISIEWLRGDSTWGKKGHGEAREGQGGVLVSKLDFVLFHMEFLLADDDDALVDPLFQVHDRFLFFLL